MLPVRGGGGSMVWADSLCALSQPSPPVTGGGIKMRLLGFWRGGVGGFL